MSPRRPKTGHDFAILSVIESARGAASAMTKEKRMALRLASRRIFILAFLALGMCAAIAAFALGFFNSMPGDISGGTGSAAERAEKLSNVLSVIEGIAIISFAAFAGILLMLARFIRERVAAPLDALRRSLISSAVEALPVSGLERKDEIGAVARAAERMRQAMLSNELNSPHGLLQAMDRLSKDAGRLEADLARLASATTRACERVEEASMKAAKASHSAIEAADLTRDGARRITVQAEDKIAELIETLQRLSAATAPNEARYETQHRTADVSHDEAAAVLDGLVEDLNALERFAEQRKALANDQAVTLTAALIEAIDRLNAVAERIGAAADNSAKHAA